MRILYDSKHAARVALGVAHVRRKITLANNRNHLVLRFPASIGLKITKQTSALRAVAPPQVCGAASAGETHRQQTRSLDKNVSCTPTLARPASLTCSSKCGFPHFHAGKNLCVLRYALDVMDLLGESLTPARILALCRFIQFTSAGRPGKSSDVA